MKYSLDFFRNESRSNFVLGRVFKAVCSVSSDKTGELIRKGVQKGKEAVDFVEEKVKDVFE